MAPVLGFDPERVFFDWVLANRWKPVAESHDTDFVSARGRRGFTITAQQASPVDLPTFKVIIAAESF